MKHTVQIITIPVVLITALITQFLRQGRCKLRAKFAGNLETVVSLYSVEIRNTPQAGNSGNLQMTVATQVGSLRAKSRCRHYQSVLLVILHIDRDTRLTVLGMKIRLSYV